MNRREFVRAVATAMLGAEFFARAEAAEKKWRVGVLGNVPPQTTPENARIWAAFVQALHERGFVEGKNVSFDLRYVEGRLERVPALVAELVQIPVDVIVVGSGPGVRAAKEATSTIPIVMSGVSDPVGAGLIASLARPGANITGVADLQIDLIPKRLQLLKAIAPTIARVAFVHGNYSGFDAARLAAENGRQDAAAAALNIAFLRFPMNTPQDLKSATAAIADARVDALLVSPNPTNFIVRKELAAFALAQRLPAIAARREEVEAGILMSYGPTAADIFSTAANYVAKILNGANPAELPVEQPAKMVLTVNAATARTLGLKLPPSLLFDEVIQ